MGWSGWGVLRVLQISANSFSILAQQKTAMRARIEKFLKLERERGSDEFELKEIEILREE